MKHGKTENFQEALDLFEKSPRIRRELFLVRGVADELIIATGSANSGEAIAESDRRQLIDMTKGQQWAGSIFRNRLKYEKVSEKKEKGAGHDDLAHRWRFTAAYAAYLGLQKRTAKSA